MNTNVRVLHTAGFCFDSPYWDGPAAWAEEWKRDLWQTFEDMLTLCGLEKVNFLFISGDLFDQDYVRKETVERVAGSLARLADTKVFITPGEKDPLVITSAYRLTVWPDNVHIFSGEIGEVEISALNSVVYGAGWIAFRQERQFLEGFHAKRDGRLHLMVLPAATEPQESDRLSRILPGQIASSGLTYLALGHRQAWSRLRKTGETFWAGCGSPEERNFRESRPPGAVLAEIAPGSVRAEYRELSRCRNIEKTEEESPTANSSAPGPSLLGWDYRQISGETGARAIRAGFPTLAQVYIAQIQNRLSTARNTQEQEHWELVHKIALAALGQGRADDED